jgi:hypothetical protein
MAKKKSGARVRAWKLLNDNPASVFHGILRGKRGRLKGETEKRRELRKQIHGDLAWLGLPYKPDLFSYLARNLPNPKWRTEYLLRPPECPKVYKTILGRHFRREIALVHNKIWGKKSRALSQNLRHQNYRATRIRP